MGQNAQAATVTRKKSTNAQSQPFTDDAGALVIGKGTSSSLNNVATAGALISATARRVCKVIVNTAASTAGGVYDSNVGGIAAAKLVFAIPQTVGIYDVDMPLTTALSLVVGTGGVVSLSYQ